MIERLPSGNSELDLILGGGVPTASLVVLAGAPGTGKTILAQQLCFSNATPDRPALYYTSLSEPHGKMIRHLESFEFFDASKIGDSVQLNHLGALVDEHSIDRVVEEVVRRSFESEASVIVIDSAKALRDIASADRFRQIVYDLASKVAHTEAVLVLVGEYTPEDVANGPEFAVADVIVTLTNEGLGALDERSLRVLKMRGSEYLTGRHSFMLDSDGFHVYPRIESIRPAPATPGKGRVPTGTAGLDQMMGGGIPSGSVTLIAGPSGAGKTVIAIAFIAEGIAKGERCVFVALEESAAQVVAKARGFGWNLEPAVKSGQLKILELQPVELGLDAVGAAIKAVAAEGPAQRIVIDSMAELEHAARGTDRFADYLWTLAGSLRALGASAVVTSETSAFFGPAFELARGLSFVVDNVVLLRYTELESDIRRALTIVKMRESDHTKTLVEFEIGSKGAVVKGRFAGVSGVLTGTPVRSEERFKEFFNK